MSTPCWWKIHFRYCRWEVCVMHWDGWFQFVETERKLHIDTKKERQQFAKQRIMLFIVAVATISASCVSIHRRNDRRWRDLGPNISFGWNRCDESFSSPKQECFTRETANDPTTSGHFHAFTHFPNRPTYIPDDENFFQQMQTHTSKTRSVEIYLQVFGKLVISNHNILKVESGQAAITPPCWSYKMVFVDSRFSLRTRKHAAETTSCLKRCMVLSHHLGTSLQNNF